MGKRVDKSNLTTCKKSTDGNMTINLTGTWTRQKNWPGYQGNDASSKRLKDSFLMMLRFVHEAH
jgi:hypothetical protein